MKQYNTIARLLLTCFGLLLLSCTNTQDRITYSDSFLERYCELENMYCYLSIPTGPEQFVILENNYVRCMIYKKYYNDTYPDYLSFLSEMMNSPSSIALKNKLGNVKENKVDEFFLKTIKTTPHFFLDSLDDTNFVIKESFLDKEYQIIKAYFDEGYYISFSDYSGYFIISDNPFCSQTLSSEIEKVN